jgi:hypothetical protein
LKNKNNSTQHLFLQAQPVFIKPAQAKQKTKRGIGDDGDIKEILGIYNYKHTF